MSLYGSVDGYPDLHVRIFLLGYDDNLCGGGEQAEEATGKQWIRGRVWWRSWGKGRNQHSCVQRCCFHLPRKNSEQCCNYYPEYLNAPLCSYWDSNFLPLHNQSYTCFRISSMTSWCCLRVRSTRRSTAMTPARTWATGSLYCNSSRHTWLG